MLNFDRLKAMKRIMTPLWGCLSNLIYLLYGNA